MSKILSINCLITNNTHYINRIRYDQLGGVEMTPDGSDVRRYWKWYEFNKPHTHAPPLQPFVLALNRFAFLLLLL